MGPDLHSKLSQMQTDRKIQADDLEIAPRSPKPESKQVDVLRPVNQFGYITAPTPDKKPTLYKVFFLGWPDSSTVTGHSSVLGVNDRLT